MTRNSPRRNNSMCLGLQADLWTEHMQTERRVEWMALPRAAALAEVGWSPPQRSWLISSSVCCRCPRPPYRAFGLDYADSVFGIDPQFARTAGGISVTLGNLPELKDAALDSSIRYNAGWPRAERDVGHGMQHRFSLRRARRFAPHIPWVAAGFAYLEVHVWTRTQAARRTSHELEL